MKNPDKVSLFRMIAAAIITMVVLTLAFAFAPRGGSDTPTEPVATTTTKLVLTARQQDIFTCANIYDGFLAEAARLQAANLLPLNGDPERIWLYSEYLVWLKDHRYLGEPRATEESNARVVHHCGQITP